ncbi:MAG: aldose 1-epimerase family protein [Clostridiales bacterium]|jgi:hypothetical protein|nr:aldose 1-epimerase family protein [Clostridiales bacterium]
MQYIGREFTKEEIRRRVGHLSQIAGIKSYTMNEGRAQGVHALDVKTGSGLGFTVLPDRALDIAWMEHNGRALGFIGKGGIVHSSYYQPYGYEWLRSFNGGVLTTCGLTQVGPPEREGIWDLGLHGRISNIPADEVNHGVEWEGDELILWIEGKVREAVIFSENLVLHRRIKAYGGRNRIIIDDEIVNEGYEDTPLMILYHMNMGFPVVDEGSELIAPIIHTSPRDEEARKGIEGFNRFEVPTPGYREQVFFHKLAVDDRGRSCAAIINEAINLGICVYYNQKELPYFTQWKMMGQQDYVVGLEPGNCVPMGRSWARERGILEYLKPGQRKTVSLEIRVLTTWEEIQGYRDYVTRLLKQY